MEEVPQNTGFSSIPNSNPSSPSSSKVWLWGGIAAVLVIVLGIFLFIGGNSDSSSGSNDKDSSGSGSNLINSGSDSCSKNAKDGIHTTGLGTGRVLNEKLFGNKEVKTYVESWHITDGNTMYLKTITVTKVLFGGSYVIGYTLEKVNGNDKLATGFSPDGLCTKTSSLIAQNSVLKYYIAQGVRIFTEEPISGWEIIFDVSEKTSKTDNINGFSCDVYESGGNSFCLSTDVCAIVSASEPGKAVIELLSLQTGGISVSDFKLPDAKDCTDLSNLSDSSSVKHDLDSLFPEADSVLENAKAYL